MNEDEKQMLQRLVARYKFSDRAVDDLNQLIEDVANRNYQEGRDFKPDTRR